MYWAANGYNTSLTVEKQLETGMHWRMSKHLDEALGRNEIRPFGRLASALWMQIQPLLHDPVLVIRRKDHGVFTSDFVKNWILRNNAELIIPP